MSVITITATNLDPNDRFGMILELGEDVDAGQLCYRSSSDGKAYVADAANATHCASLIGVSGNSGVAGQPVSFPGAGLLEVGTLFTGLTNGAPLYLGSGVNAGKLVTIGELVASTDYVAMVGWIVDADTFYQYVLNTGLVVGTIA